MYTNAFNYTPFTLTLVCMYYKESSPPPFALPFIYYQTQDWFKK